jgi:hypothetical protein
MATQRTQRPWTTVVLLPVLVAAALVSAAYARAPAPTAAAAPDSQQPPAGDSTQAPAVRVVFDDAAIRPENRDAVRLIRESGAFQRAADWTNQRVALPYGIEIRVTDTLPHGVDDPTTELDGRTIYYPAEWLTMNREFLAGFVAEVLAEGGPPSAFPREKFNADDLMVWANEYILGHEMGHALVHQLTLPVTGLDEDAADGYAAFSTLNGTQGPGPALAAAILFDGIALRMGELTFEDFSSDHPVVQQRTYNFLCYVVGSDPARLRHSLVVEGYLPELRAMMCPLQWAQLNYGWLSVLEPHSAPGFRAEAAQARARAREALLAEERALQESLRRAPGQ